MANAPDILAADDKGDGTQGHLNFSLFALEEGCEPMRWRRQRWPERQPRPKARTLSDEEKKTLLAGMTKEIASSPVLTGLGLQVRSQRGRFYLERPLGEGDSAGVEAWGRITPLADSNDLLLEHERRQGSWSEIARGSARQADPGHRR